jgi:chemotaxis methyl-accepting protein methylase
MARDIFHEAVRVALQ